MPNRTNKKPNQSPKTKRVVGNLQGRPIRQGMYFPEQEKDSCGVGFICHIKGQASRQIIDDANHINCCMTHRGGQGYETNTGDGAGILTGMPHRFLQKVATNELGIELPEPNAYGCGIVFLPQDAGERAKCKATLEAQIEAHSLRCLGWRNLPVDPTDLGAAALAAMPAMAMLFIGADNLAGDALERKLYLIRKHSTHLLRADDSLLDSQSFYVCSLSARIIIYKGMLTPEQLFPFFQDLNDADFESHLAMIHARFSTNTFPSWDRAQPNRFMSHNGEINTLLGNKNWMNARQGTMKSELFGEDLAKLFPIVEPDCSDSGTFDNVLEFLLMTGRSLQEAVMLMIPEAWQNHRHMSPAKKDFYEYHSCLMEPWDGPASIAFTDGHYIGAVLDRNGLRPSRYYITDDDKCIMASEVGVLPIKPAGVIKKGRLEPGRMFLIDFDAGRMITDEELKTEFAQRRPYGEWLREQHIDISELRPAPAEELAAATLTTRMQAFGYTAETMQFMLVPLVTEQRDPLSSMGNDAALAVLSDEPRMLYDYFKQLFAQVTNPSIDSIREEAIMALECFIGPETNLLEATKETANRLRVPHPILSNQELAAIRQIDINGWRSYSLDMTFPAGSGWSGLNKTLAHLCAEATKAIEAGYKLVVLSDRRIGPERTPICALVAVGAVHQHLIRTHARTRIGIVVETGEAREVHHHCLLIGYGADAINPYLALEALWQARQDGKFQGQAHLATDAAVTAAYRKGTAKGILKVMAKMGISTLQSYKGAQIFEAVGLAEDVIERCFTGTVSRVQGVSMAVLAEEMERRHERGYPTRPTIRLSVLPNPGDVHWRAGGDHHMWNPQAIASLQSAVTTNKGWEAFAEQANQEATRKCTIRGLLSFRTDIEPVPLAEVEPESEIVKRFATGAMSFGSISREAHETLAVAMNRIGGKSNTGEGGEEDARFVPMENGDSKRSAIKQVASGRFGVTINYLTNADELQIKIVQGAKPGEGGELPGHKVDEVIAKVRYSTPGVGLISPPPHHDIYSIEDIAQLIHDLKNANPKARISVKLGSEIGVGAVAAGVTKAKSDHLVIAGHDGGTGASPLTSIKHAGLPWELGIAETHHTLVTNNLRSRVILQVDGQLKTGRDIAIACLLGAEEFGFATAPLIAMGCIMMRKCHLNTCPVGIATQDVQLRKKFQGQPEHVVNYFFMVAKELRAIMASLGLRSINDMVGRADLLGLSDAQPAVQHWKASGLDLQPLLERSAEPCGCLGTYAKDTQEHGLELALDNQLLKLAEPALARGEPVRIDLPVTNSNRVVGAILSHNIITRIGPQMLPDDSIWVKLQGSAGQSLGAWLAKGVTLEVAGDANDYVGKGLSGGRIIIYPPAESPFKAEENIIAGNVVLYGATSGEAFFRGQAAERFCVRNSGACAVVEGVGDHGCEYMTGGRVIVLGATGRNFAAGMSGGIAYVFDPQKQFAARCNIGMVELEKLSDLSEAGEVRTLIQRHRKYTGSTVAERILASWPEQVAHFVKVMPTDYKKMLETQAWQQPSQSASVRATA